MNCNNDADLAIAFQKLGWKPLKHMRKKAKAKLMYKNLNKSGSKKLKNLFTYKNENINHSLRYVSNGLSLLQPRTNDTKNSFMYQCAHLWNCIPNEITKCKTIFSFRKNCYTS